MSEPFNTTRSELEHLRDILYGDFARDAETRLYHLDKQLSEAVNHLNNQIVTQSDLQTDKVEELKESINEHLTALTNEVRAEIEVIKNRLDRLEANFADRNTLSEWLFDLGRQLQEKQT